MPASRRFFLKGMIAGAGAALEGLPPFADATTPAAPSRDGGHDADNAANQPQAVASHGSGTTPYNREPGVFPGAPGEDFAPSFAIDASTYRNLALHRPAYHSSSYDYNLTAQLITDGIKDTRMPTWVSTSLGFHGPLSKTERENLLDGNAITSVELRGPHPTAEIQFGGGESAPEIDRVDLMVIAPDGVKASELSFGISVSEDGRDWKKAGSVLVPEAASLEGLPEGFAQPGRFFTPSIALQQGSHSRFYRVECSATVPAEQAYDLQWQLADVAFFHGRERVEAGGPYRFTSAWMSAGLGEEWVYVDLGARCEIDKVALYWIARAAEASIQFSDDAQNWRTIQAIGSDSGPVDEMKLAQPVTARYVRVLMMRPGSPNGYILSELEVYGRGGPVAQARPSPAASADGRMDLAGGAWRLQRDSLVPAASGATLSMAGFKDSDWIVATVPGTVLTSYFSAGAIPDPNFGENQLYISDSFFYADFWYRTEFVAPPAAKDQMAWLNLDGINWKAEVFLNGERLGRIEGAFQRARFDVTSKMRAGQPNALAVSIKKNATPGSCKQKTYQNPGKNGGALGADNPTYHASIGWDWIPTVRGRNTGIWDSVYLATTGPVSIESPHIVTTLPLPDTSSADVSIEVDLINHNSKTVAGILRGRFGDITFEWRVTLKPSSTTHVKLDPSTHPALHLQSPRLWWPVGYGEPHLHEVEISFEHGDRTSDKKTFKAGIRQMASSEEGGALKLYINGRRFIPRGGNWGFSESMLRYRARDYDAAVRYHREMNFTMIRNWVGQIGGDAFYEACDRHGVMVWQDFWLANPFDGPNPDDDRMFLSNARDMVLRIRNHASIGLYCGRNEGYPPKPLEAGIRSTLADLHPGIHYIPSSADDVVSGHGPYQAMPLSYYFTSGAGPKLHSEMGMPNIPPIESVRAMMPASAAWPQSLDWGLHDFCLTGAQGGTSFRAIIENGYGGSDLVEEWVTLAQFVNYEGYRAMFESQSKYRMGLLLWMSHPCWPSFVWQTYDYYLEPTAAYFGCKKASEPLHIQWNRATEIIEVVNYSGGDVTGLTATVELLNMNAAKRWEKTVSLDSREDSVAPCIPMQYSADVTPVHFIRLTLKHGSDVISTNFYLRGVEEGNYKAIRQLPKVRIESSTKADRQGDTWKLVTNLHNSSSSPALMVRLKAVREKAGDRILPAIYNDNYISLMPGERRIISTELAEVDTRGEHPRIVIAGFNVE